MLSWDLLLFCFCAQTLTVSQQLAAHSLIRGCISALKPDSQHILVLDDVKMETKALDQREIDAKIHLYQQNSSFKSTI